MGSASKTPHMQGGFASLFDALPAQCVQVPGTMPLEAAALAEPLAVCLHAVARAGHGRGPARSRRRRRADRPADDAGGATRRHDGDRGRRHRGGAARLRDAARRRRGRRCLGRRSEPLAGSRRDPALRRRLRGLRHAPPALASAIWHVRRGGTVVQIGNLPGGTIPVPANAVMASEIDLKGSFRFGREFEEAVRLIVDGTGRRSLDRHGGAPTLGGSGRLPPGSRPLAEREGDADRGVTRPRARDGARLPEPITGGRESRRGPA